MADKIEKLFETCINNYDHCGEFDFHGNKIVVFRRCGSYDFESPYRHEDTGMPPYVEGDESVIAIVNNEYATDWYCPCDYDLKYAMEDAIEWIFKNKNIKIDFIIEGHVESSALYERRGIKGRVIEALKGEFENFELVNFEIYDSWGRQCKFKVKVQGGWEYYKALIDEPPFYAFEYRPLEDGEFELANDEDKELFEQMFSYKISFL
jgi:hypothetical protein